MMFRSALWRLALQYFVLLVLILALFDLLVYFTVLGSLQGRIHDDLRHSVDLAQKGLTATGDTVTANPQMLANPDYADTFVRVQQVNIHQVILPGIGLAAVFSDSRLNPAVRNSEQGHSSQTQVVSGTKLFIVATTPIRNKTGKVVGVLQVAQPISWVDDAMSRLVRQVILASVVGLVLGALASLLMATRSIRPISKAFQRQREFVADASHELRTPLTLIRTNVEAWLRRADGGNRVYGGNIIEEVEHLNRIVGDLITLALADARQLRLERKAIDLSDVIRDLITQTEPLAESRGVILRPELNGARVDADPGRVQQLLLILIDNALSHTPSGGQVSVAVVRENSHARVTVSDNGDGISSADLPHIFERFYRGDKARTRKNGGSGLGLAIAKWIVDAHKGDIKVKSKEGKGTEVSVRLPALD